MHIKILKFSINTVKFYVEITTNMIIRYSTNCNDVIVIKMIIELLNTNTKEILYIYISFIINVPLIYFIIFYISI